MIAVVVGRRPLVVLGAGLREQRAIVVEAEVQRVGDRRGGAVAREQAVDGRLVRQVGRRRHERALADERGRRQQIEERHAVLAVAARRDRCNRATASAWPPPSANVVPNASDALVCEQIALLGVAVLRIEARAFEMIERDEVDDAGHRVRAIHGRGAAGDRLHARQDRVRHQIDVDGAEDVRERQPPPSSSTRLRLAPRACRLTVAWPPVPCPPLPAAARRRELRQLIERRFDRDRAALLQALDRRDHDRARRLAVRIGDQRAGDDHFLEAGFAALRVVLGGRTPTPQDSTVETPTARRRRTDSL